MFFFFFFFNISLETNYDLLNVCNTLSCHGEFPRNRVSIVPVCVSEGIALVDNSHL